ncbi:MAG: hypothetical protein NC824_05915, partial [Candidatus Omnitrophica bacterium]|nr:hypothetical protein [Candidatus Omnitrophota bacterium]
VGSGFTVMVNVVICMGIGDFLDFLLITKAEIPSDIYGKSLLPLIEGKTKKIRDFVVSAPPIIHGSPGGEKVTITDKSGWCLIYESKKGEKYNIRAVDSIERETVREKVMGNKLYFLPKDQKQQRNLIQKYKEVGEGLREKFIDFLREVKTDEKIINLWR